MDRPPSSVKTSRRRKNVVTAFISILFPAASALLLSLSFPPHDVSSLAWFALAPFFFGLRHMGLTGAAAHGFLFGVVFCVGTFWWSHVIDSAILFKILFYIAFGFYFFLFGLIYRLLSNRCGGWMVVAAPGLWVTIEYVRSNFLFLSLPWNLLGHSQHQFHAVIQVADVTGVYGISFLLVMVNQVFSEVPDMLAKRSKSQVFGHTASGKLALRAGVVALVFLSVISYGWHRTFGSVSNKVIRVAIVQANLLTEDDMPLDAQSQHLKIYQELSREAMRYNPALIVWPSSSLPGPFTAPLVRFTVRELARELNVYLLVGGAGREKFSAAKPDLLSYSNSEFLVSPSGRLEGRYDKIVLVPFDEYLPLEGKIAWPGWVTKRTKSFVRGSSLTLFEVEGVRFGTPICWENMFPDFFRRFVLNGANFMVSATNEGFLGESPAPYQSFAMNVFRAVENRVALVRSATTGVSAFINPDGRVVERVMSPGGKDLFISGVLVRDVPVSERKTFYTVYGDLFAYVAVCLTLVVICVSLVTQRGESNKAGLRKWDQRRYHLE